MQPSPSELPLLKALWSNDRLSARELHDRVASQLGWSLSSTRKTLDRMIDKGLVAAEDQHGMKVYRAAVEKVSTLAGLTRQFARAVLEIDGPLPTSSFTGSKILSEDELEELQKFLDEEGGK
ncbi:BlaI/MecI/CopY family transcriptional regulator [Hoeflea sp. TYP-13]|uniref:BlaI/MecI/CopY family transcriptional regulator n=1 Tax=Hoeflea sp. TYP-13 TaxID=3230023 RepID=UPI0034C5BF81